MRSAMSESEIASFIGRKVRQSLNENDGDISDVRIQNYNLYMGKPYGNERDGYSSIVTREALETVEWALPAVLRVFTSGDRYVEYDPVGPDDEDQAEQETDIANYYIRKANNGFVSLHHWCKDCLMYPNGYLGLWIDETERTRLEEYEGLTAVGLQQVLTHLAGKGDVEVVEQSTETKEHEGKEYECYNVKIRVTWKDKKPCLEAIPPDELLIDNDLTSIDLDEADFICRRLKKSYSKLVREGYDPDKLDEIGSYEDYDWLDERTNRLFFEDEDPDGQEEDDDSMREFWVHDCYLYLDTDGDGLAEFRHITMIGADIFVDEEVSYQPYMAMAAVLTPHRHAGLSYVDIVKDLQEIKSTLWRQLLDNIYKLNARRKYVGDAFISDEGGTLDVLLDNTSEFIPARDPTAIQEEMVQPIVSDLLPVIQGVNDLQNVRTGVSPQLSLDPSVLQESTMGAFRSALDEASQRIEMLVRIFAETGFKKLFVKMHQIIRTHMDKPLALKLRGDWIEANPAIWDERTDVTVNTGLGFNNKDQKMMLVTQLLTMQREALQAGLSNPEKIFNALEDWTEYSGVGHTQRYWVDPKTPEYKPPEPPKDPYVEVEMGKLQQKSQEMQFQAQKEQAEMRFKLNDEQRKNQELLMKMREMEARVADLAASTEEKLARMFKTYEEAQGQDIANDQLRNDPGLGREAGSETAGTSA